MIVGIGSAKGDLTRYLGFSDQSGGLDAATSPVSAAVATAIRRSVT